MVPNVLYKYRTLSERNISMIGKNQVYFSSPLSFNDPFDGRYHEDGFETIQLDSMRKMASLLGINPQIITDDMLSNYMLEIAQHPQVIDETIRHQKRLKDLLEITGVLSLSARNDSILMWSHYADHHKGLCLGYKNNLGFERTRIHRVRYSEDRNNDHIAQYLLSLGESPNESLQRIFQEALLTKYKDWFYEEEWRIIGDIGVLDYAASDLDCIIFGLNMPSEDRELVMQLLPIEKVKFFECIKSKHKFEVEIKALVI